MALRKFEITNDKGHAIIIEVDTPCVWTNQHPYDYIIQALSDPTTKLISKYLDGNLSYGDPGGALFIIKSVFITPKTLKIWNDTVRGWALAGVIP